MYWGSGCGPGAGYGGYGAGYGAAGYGAGYGAAGYGAGYGCGGYGCGGCGGCGGYGGCGGCGGGCGGCGGCGGGYGGCGAGGPDSDKYSSGGWGSGGWGSSGRSSERGGSGGGDSASGAGDKDRLVEKVKERQRQGERYKQAWYEFCRQKGTSNYDPARHNEADLQEFLDQDTEALVPLHSRDRDSEGCSDEALVAKVKDWQRKGKGHKEAWYSFCRRNGTDKYDPSRHDAETLRDFIRGIESGSITPREDGSSGCGSPSGCGWGGYGGWGGWGWMPGMKGGKGGEWDMMQMMGMMYGGNPGCGGSSGSDGEKEGRPGDWICPGCKNVNFSRREDCNKCGTSGRGAKRLGMKQGDWICPKCGDLVFASKSVCTMCRYERPDEEGSSSKRYSPY